ncbi:MAG: hypothetical protein JSW10_02145 [Pseudomonadota bacterium]|nr:MAG: hypothetical protein JSW10_02145 [Pseudomonadota bacterium]
MRHAQFFLAVAAVLILAGSSHAQEPIELEGTSIIGNRELPKVLYVVPWKESELPDLGEPTLESHVEQALSPVDRNVFRRQVHYYNSLSK